MAKKETVLVVDDQPENITLLVDALQDSYSMFAAIDGETALDIVHSDEPPDIILLDVMMPRIDGYEVCRTLKSDPKTRDIPIIFITALVSPEDETRGLELGAVDYITKPISPPVVLARVKTHLQLKRAKEMLVAHNESLEELVHKRTLDVIRVERERSESLQYFSNAVAHQIRNPVTVIGGMAGLLSRKLADGDPLMEYVRCVRDEGRRLESIVTAVGEYVQLTPDVVAPVAVKEVVETAIGMVGEASADSGELPRYTVDLEEAEVVVDVELAAKAVAELIRNAVDFSGNPSVHVSIAGRVNSSREAIIPGKLRYAMTVADDGPGIDADLLPYLLDPFFTTKAQGVGMGLTKVRHIICEEFEGNLVVDSRSDGQTGVMVSFDLPLAGG